MTALTEKRCKPLAKGSFALSRGDADRLHEQVSGWEIADDGKAISKSFSFEGYRETIGFVNAVAWIANREDHHPDLEVGYGSCRMTWSTHSVGGLSENDFICAAKVDALFV